MKSDELLILAKKISEGTASDEEIVLYNTIVDKLIKDGLEQNGFSKGDNKPIKEELFSRIEDQIYEEKMNRKTNMVYLITSVAAAILVILSISILFVNTNDQRAQRASTQFVEVEETADVLPGGNKAILTLADGSRISLDSLVSGELVNHNGIYIKKNIDGELEYTISNNTHARSGDFNTIETPVGGKYKVILPDGTKVWLNSASYIKYPVTFDMHERRVTLVGEAYFEVKKMQGSDKQSVPFIVESNKQRIEVLGTNFNVNSYSDDEYTKTTLTEGSVRVSSTDSKSSKLLKPGQQSIIRDGKISVQTADIESDIAWKNGDFIFKQEELQSVMKKIARWYDVEIEYLDINKDVKFSGAISRSKNLSAVLEMMELTGEVKFKIKERRVYVMS